MNAAYFRGYFVGRADAAQLRVCRQCRLSMSRHIYLRNHRYISLGSISYHFFDLFLRVETAVLIFPSPSANLCQIGILFNFDSPSLVVCQMPMKMIQPMECQQINDSLYLSDREEMTAHIQHGSPIRQGRIIFQFHRRNIQRLCR